MEKHIRDFTSFKNKRRDLQTTDTVNESVIQMGDKYRIMNGIDVPQSLVNAVAKKVKEETGKKLSNIYSDTQVAEEIVKYIASEFLKIESLPSSIFIGGEDQSEDTTNTEDVPAVVATEDTTSTDATTDTTASTDAADTTTTDVAATAPADTKEEPKFEEPKKEEDNELPS